MKEQFDALKNSPIFAMSLGSKELFHSNFWAWMIKKYPKYATVFFDNIETVDIDTQKIGREENHRDLTIHMRSSKKVYVIENKFKALPDEDQLNNYKKKLNDKFEQGCLTYMIEPYFKESTEWKHLSYKDIPDKMKSISIDNMDCFNKTIINKYCEVLSNLTQTLNTEDVCDSDSFTFVAPGDYKELRIHDVYSKILCSRFEQYFKKNYSKCDANEYSFICKTDYSNQNANLTIKYQRLYKDNEKGDTAAIGIQIQGNSIRHFVEIKKQDCKNITNCKEDIFNKFAEKGWFDKNYDAEKKKEIKLLGLDKFYTTSMNPKAENGKKYNTYKDKNNKGIFIYQYYNIPQNLTYKSAGDLFDKTLGYILSKDLLSLLNSMYKNLY